MVLNLLVLVLIVLTTLYLSTQGMLSAMLALATSIFSSILAMALLEPLQNIVGGWRPDYARGVTFLLLFFLIFSLTRIIADMAVPKNIKLSLWTNRIVGGCIGFFAAMVVVGNMVIGIEMLPVGRAPMGFERFPEGSYMQALDDHDNQLLGEMTKMHNVWFKPDRFVLAIWNGASGRSLGGGRAFASVHPDLSVESYGYRNHFDGSQRTLPDDLMKVTASWKSTDPLTYPQASKSGRSMKDASGKDIIITLKPRDGDTFVMVRTEITKGSAENHTASDPDNLLRVAASQVRLIAQSDKKAEQFYPVGYMEGGKIFRPLALDFGYVADEFNTDGTATDDWIFQIPADENPVSIEVKQLARKDLALEDRSKVELAKSYPPHQYYRELSTLTASFTPKSAHDFKSATVLVLRSGVQLKNISTGPVTTAHNYAIDVDGKMKNGANGWKEAGGPGVPALPTFLSAESTGLKILDGQPDEILDLNGLTLSLLVGQVQSDGQINIRNIPQYFNNDFVDYLSQPKSGASIIEAAASDDPSFKTPASRSALLNGQNVSADVKRPESIPGQLVVSDISKGQHYVIFAMSLTKGGADRAFYVWFQQIEFGEEQKGKNADGSPKLKQEYPVTVEEGKNDIFHIDLDEP